MTRKLIAATLLATLGLLAQELIWDFKADFARLPKNFQSADVTNSPGPAFLLSSDNRNSIVEPKGDPKFGNYTGKGFFKFPDKAGKLKGLKGKRLTAVFDAKHLSGSVPFGAGFRVAYGKDSAVTNFDFAPAIDGEWRTYTTEIQVPESDDLRHVAVRFGFYHKGDTPNIYVIDNLKVYTGMSSELKQEPAYSLGMAALLDKAPLPLVKDGKPTFTIMLEDKPRDVATFAAQELQDHMELMTGARPPIQKGGNAPQGPAVWIGENTMTRKYGVAPQMLPMDNWVVGRSGQNILLAGGDSPHATLSSIRSNPRIPLGTLYATYEFLERVFNVRWFWPGPNGTVAPKAENVSVTRLFESGDSQYTSRMIWYSTPPSSEIRPEEVRLWHRRIRLGGTDPNPIANHGLRNLYQKYGNKPEIFALASNGTRKVNSVSGTHLCLTNPETLEVAVKEAVEFFRKNPAEKFFSVMPGDSNGLHYCRCPKCQKALDATKPEDGVQSNAVWGFINDVAKRVAVECPGKFIKCCAYAEYRRKPDFPLQPNIAVTICYSPAPIGTPRYKENWRKFIDEWSQTGAALYFWEYWLARYHRGVYGAPAVFPRQLKEIYAIDRNQIKGRAIELSDIDSYGNGIGNWADWLLDMPNLYIAFKLMWNSQLDVEDELLRYYRDFFGPAEAPIREFYDTLELAWTKSTWSLQGKQVWDHDACWSKTYPPELVDHLMDLLKEAVRLTDGNMPYDYRTKKLLQAYQAMEFNSKLFRGKKESDKQRDLTLAVSKAPAIDGTVNDDEWKDAIVLKDFVDCYNVYPIASKSEVLLKQDGTTLYIAGKASIPENHTINGFPAPDTPARDSFLWGKESMELFFTGKDDETFQFIVAPDNLLLDAHWDDANRDKLQAALLWNPEVQWKTSRDGNNWQMELAIPLACLKLANPIAPNAFKFNAARNHYYKKNATDRSFAWEQAIWLPTYGGFHKHDKYGTLTIKK